jgi:hypothetical protein
VLIKAHEDNLSGKPSFSYTLKIICLTLKDVKQKSRGGGPQNHHATYLRAQSADFVQQTHHATTANSALRARQNKKIQQ